MVRQVEMTYTLEIDGTGAQPRFDDSISSVQSKII